METFILLLLTNIYLEKFFKDFFSLFFSFEGKYQGLNSQISSVSVIDGIPIYSGPFLGQARVHTDYDPEPQEKDALILRVRYTDDISSSVFGSFLNYISYQKHYIEDHAVIIIFHISNEV